MTQTNMPRSIRSLGPLRILAPTALALVLAVAYVFAAQSPSAAIEKPGAPASLEKVGAPTPPAKPTVTAAAQPAAPVPKQAPRVQAVAKPGGILRIGGERDVAGLDPHTSHNGWDISIMQNVYSGLVRAGTDILPKPDLATRWDFKTPTRLEFTLRQGVKFHNGREVTSEDVKFSLERMLDPKVPAIYASTIATIESIETPSKSVVVLNLKRPDAAIVANLSLPSMAIVAKEAVKPMPVGLTEGMMGSGPFMFKEHIKGQRLVLVKNPNYYEKGQPLLNEIHFIPLVDETARTNALRAGQADFIEPVPPKDVNTLRRDSRIVVTGGPNLSFVAIGLNTSKKPFDDVRVRRALAYAIDRKEMVEKAFDGFAQPLLGPPLIPPYWAGNKETYYELDRERAKRLLAEAGYPDGFKTSIRIGTVSYHASFAAVVQSELKKVGIEVAIQASDSASASRAWAEGNFEMYPIRWWGADFVDPDGAFTPPFSCKGTYNHSRFCDPEIDKLLAKGLEVTSIEERKEAYRIAMQRLAEQQPWVFLVAFDRFQAMRSHVNGYTAYPNGSQYSFREVWLGK